MRIGINPISWTNDDLPALGGETPLETALTEGKAIGYEGFELGNKFPREPEALRAVLARHGLACVSGWYSGRLARGTVADEIAAVEAHLALLAANGAQVMVYGEVADSIQGRPEALVATAAFHDRRRMVGVRRARHGVRAAHARPRRASRVPSSHGRVRRDAGGRRPPDASDRSRSRPAARYRPRDVRRRRRADRAARSTSRASCHVHCKDVRPAVARMARNRGWSFLDSVLNGAFSTPGEGCVDFAAVIGILRDAGYRGWLVVEGEQDPAVAPAYRYAEMAYRLLSALVAGKSDAEARAAAMITQRAAA